MRLPQPITLEDSLFIPFTQSIASFKIPERFTYPFKYTPDGLSMLAATELQHYLEHQIDWEHNFGLQEGQKGTIIGKMFGVLVVETKNNNIGYLAAFSGKLAGSYHHSKFVPPIFDSLAKGSFLNEGMAQLTLINQEIKALAAIDTEIDKNRIEYLKNLRRTNSIVLQNKLFDEFQFINESRKEKSLRAIFKSFRNHHPPAGAGECAAPKLLQYAFKNEMKPLTMAEFWWGLSPKSDFWVHGQYYPACKEKCEPILTYMLENISMDAQQL
jgi:tRNA pseudouridine32 synthase / 23S rRNA pseudouridine746 synthase